MRTKLILEDNTIINGRSFGARKSTAGEVVFSTAMTGYIEALTDPSYRGQILILSYPLIGNYGVPNPSLFQSKKIQVSGLVIAKHCPHPSHYQNQKSLSIWLKENGIPGIDDVDTRALTQKIRRQGTMLGKIQISSQNLPFYNPDKKNLVAQVSSKKVKIYQSPQNKKTVCLIDCGCKRAIITSFLKRQINIIAVPWNYDPLKGNLPPFTGVVFSNGPGNPKMVRQTISIAQKMIKAKIPTLGICLGYQILALAAGAKTYKLKFGHRSLNQPIKDLNTNKCFVTSQNHGFVIDQKTLPKNWQTWFTNLNDNSCEGIKSQDDLFWGVQFHPEGHPGPEDTEFIFDEFIKKL